MKQQCLSDAENKVLGAKVAPSADTVEEIVRNTGIKPYWVKLSPTGNCYALMAGTGPIEHCIANVCNVEWARKIRDALNRCVSNAGSEARIARAGDKP